MRTFTVIAGVGLALTSGLLTGCGGTTDAAPPSPASSTTTPTASPSPTAPVLPEAAKANTKAGAVAFVRHYVDLINHAQATGDTQPLAAVEDKHCKSCRSGRAYVESVYSKGHISGGAWQIAQLLGAVANPSTRGYNVDLIVKFGPQTVHREGAKSQHLRGGRLPLTVFTERETTGWRVREWTRAR